MNTKYDEIVKVENIGGAYDGKAFTEVVQLADQEKKVPASKDGERIGLLLVDCQNDFINPNGALAVPGAVEDMERVTRFIYQNMDKLYRIYCTVDWHLYAQIFSPNYWENEKGNHPDPNTNITYEDVKNGIWKPTLGVNKALTYLKEIESKGFTLTIWPYHCRAYFGGAAIETETAKMIAFHSAYRDSEPVFFCKGMDPHTEMYGVIKGEYDENGFVNQDVLNVFEELQKIYLAGEAGSHCFIRSIQQIVERFANRPDILKKMVVLEDCTSPIQGYEQYMQDAFEELKQEYGIQFVTSTDVVL